MKTCPYCMREIADADMECLFCWKDQPKKVNSELSSINKDKILPEMNHNCTRERLGAYCIDIGMGIFIIPLFLNIYYYFKNGDTIGKKIMWIKIVDTEEGKKPVIWQLIGRVFGKVISIFMLGCELLGYWSTISTSDGMIWWLIPLS